MNYLLSMGETSPGTSAEERLFYDQTTGLRNEFLFKLRLPDEFANARRAESNGSIFFLKLDNIIEINSKFGRESGNDALRAVAHVLENSKLSEDHSDHLVFKLGGPLFAYYIPSATAPRAREIAGRLLEHMNVSELFIEKLIVSIGIVNFYEFFMEEGSIKDLCVRIEQTALFRLGIAVQKGGNTICDSSEISEHITSGRPTVLIVDPDPPSIELIARALAAKGMDVRPCENGEIALSLVEAKLPSVIICDAMVSHIDGFTLRERLRSNALWNAIPFILVSHKKTEEMIVKAVERDIRHFFRKPVSITEIVGLVVNITRSRMT